jgi:NAD(P)H-dependent FMN reductase
LTVFNGSPRSRRSSTRILLGHFLSGFEETQDNTHDVSYLNRRTETGKLVDTFAGAEMVLLAYPIYTDAMPSIVKSFIESLAPLRGRPDNPPLMFFVHSGFPEAVHCRYAERYNDRLARRLGCRHAGSILKGGTNRVDTWPRWMSKGLYKRFHALGRRFGETGKLDAKILAKLARPERFSAVERLMIRLMDLTPLQRLDWDRELRKNGALARSFARPYEP